MVESRRENGGIRVMDDRRRFQDEMTESRQRGYSIAVIRKAMEDVYPRQFKEPRRKDVEALSYYITKTWDGDAITHHPIQITIGPSDHAARNIKITVTGPFFDDPPNPGGAPGQPFDGLWDYEGDRIIRLHFKLLPLNYTATITGNRWKGVAYIPWEYFPPGVTKFNAYAIHGSWFRKQ
ncbi:hypothetical protein FSP39_001969 [Pinctada imbricata]|uniref:Uncharacterized protein n=1 Tax=Pinctada imbricata TaxID=66713 RepID=A0AA89BYK0_PINIB|nr:hypothetical protein FSP39_001969 [Pinctada imbricata]